MVLYDLYGSLWPPMTSLGREDLTQGSRSQPTSSSRWPQHVSEDVMP